MKKKYSLLVTLMITFLLVVVFTWIIPRGTYYSGSFVKGDVVPFGLVDLLKIPLWTASTIFQFSLIFLIIGGFYGVLNKTGVYSTLIEKVVKRFKKKPSQFLIIVVLSLGILSSVMGGSLYLFLLVPFLTSVLFKLGYGKITAFLATIGSLFVGTIGATFAFDINGYINYYLSLDLSAGLIYKIVILILSLGLLLFFLLKLTKKEDKVEEVLLCEETKKESKKESKSIIPLVVVTVLGVVLCLIGTFSWQDMYGISFFNDIHTSLMKVTIGDYAIVSNILGGITAIGNWSSQEVNILILLMSLIIGWVYSIKFKDILDAFLDGAKQMFPTFIYATLANILIVILMNSSTGEFINYTIIDFFFNLGKSFNALSHGIAVIFDSLFVNYFPYLSSDVLQSAKSVYTDVTVYPVMGLVTQMIYGLSMYVLPTNIILMAGLSFFKIPYKEWLKSIWKYLLLLLSAIIVVALIASLI